MSSSKKKAAVKPVQPAPPRPEDEVVHVPKGKSKLRFFFMLGLTLFVLVTFTVGDFIVSAFQGGRTSNVYMTWTHPTDGVQEIDYPEFVQYKRRLDDFYRVQGVRPDRQQSSDENVAYLVIADRLARDAGIEVADAELGRAILEGGPGGGRRFLNKETYLAYLAANEVSAQDFEATLRWLMRVNRYDSLIAFTLGQAEPEAIEKLWLEDHQQYAFDLVGVAPDDLREEAESELPAQADLEAWYTGLSDQDRQRLFGGSYLPQRMVVELLSWNADSEAPAALLERFPRPLTTDLDVLGKDYYDRFLSRRFIKPDATQEPQSPPPDGGAPPPQEGPSNLAYEEVAERAKVEAQVHAALADLFLDLRTRLQAQEQVDLAALAAELGLSYESDGLARSRDEWIQAADVHLADAVGSTGPDGLVRGAVVGPQRLYLARVVERKPSEPPPFADVHEAARTAWIDERRSSLAKEKLEALRAALAPTPATEVGTEPPAETPPATATVVVDAETFAANAQEQGLTVVHQDWFDPSERLDAAAEPDDSAESFLRSAWYPGAELYTLAEGTVAEPRPSQGGARVWLVRSAGKRDPPEIKIRPAEYDGLRRRARLKNASEAYERLHDPAELGRRYGLAFPGRGAGGP